jgi:alkylhydroperoxidase family enzyme
MDLNAAGLLRAGDNEAKLAAVEGWRDNRVFSDLERAVLAYAEAMTYSDHDVDDVLFAEVNSFLRDGELVELTAWICLENFYSKFNRSFRIEDQGFCILPRSEEKSS